MRMYLFNRARKIILNKWIKKTNTTARATYFQIKNQNNEVFNVNISYTDNGTIEWGCDCPFSGIKGEKHKAPCSHVLSAICYMIGVRGKESSK